MGLIVLPPTRGPAKMKPPCGPVTGSPKAFLIDKGLEIIEGVIVYLLPVFRQNLRHSSQEMRRQAGNLDPGKNKEPGVAGHEGKMPLPHRLRPADEPVAAPDMPGRRGPGKTGNGPAFGKNDVFEM